MNVTKLITTLQKVANTATTAAEYAALSKSVEKLQLGKVVTVSTTANLPTNLSTNGNVYFVSSDEDLYYNVGSTWNLFYNTSNVTYAWGLNSYGRLGDNTETNRSSPITIVGGITNWSMLSGGGRHSLGVTATGIAYAWGGNGQGTLGDGTTVGKSSPVTVVGGITNWSSLSAGTFHSLGVTTTGIAYSWGYNGQGRLGDNTTSSRLSPVTVVGGITNWSQVSAGGSHSLGLTSTGVVYGWGYNTYGRIGDNTTTSRSSPVTVVGGITTWNQIVTGGFHSLGRTSSGIVYAWGRGSPLGDGTGSDRSSPVTVVGGITNWSQLSAGAVHSLGVTSTGIAYAWGGNASGQLGDNTTSTRNSPVTVVGGITNWSQLGTGGTNGGSHSLGITSAGIAYGWGRNFYGQIGDSTTTSRSSPVSILGGITGWTKIYIGDQHSLAISTVIL